MSNAMRSGKRTLAGLAAGALVAGLVPIGLVAAATSANAAVVSGTVSPVRVTTTGSALDQVSYAKLSWKTTAGVATTDSIELAITNAPSSVAKIGIVANASIGTATSISSGALSGTTSVLGTPASVVYGATTAALGTAAIGIAASEAGNYTGTLTQYTGGVANAETVSFSFTTVGAPTALTLTPASQNVAVTDAASVTAKLTTSTGALTQPLAVDAVTTSSSPASGIVVQALTTVGGDANSLFDGSAVFTATPSAAGTYAVTATPSGTISGLGAQTVSVVAASSIAPTSAIVSAPTSGVSTSSTVYTAPVSVSAPGTSTVYAATSVKDITFTVTGATAGAKVAYTVTDSLTSPAGVTDDAGTVTLGADKTATLTVTASAPYATGPTAGATYTVDFGVASGNQVAYTVQYGLPNKVNVGNVTTSPKIGTSSFVKTGTAAPVVVTVTNQFGLPLAGAVVASSPSASTGTTATTGSDGTATISVAAPASSATTSQTVTFTATFGGTTSSATSAVTFLYNDSGAPTSLSLASTAGTVAQTALVSQLVDTAGTNTGVWAATSSTTKKQWMAVTATVGGSVTGVPVTFSGTGLYFNAGSADTLNATATKAGTYSGSTAAGTVTVYVKATKTGTATVSVTAGTLTETITWNVGNESTDARVVTLSPASQDAAKNASLTAEVTDAFGNPVGGVSLTFSEVGVGIFPNGSSTLVTATGPTGVVTVQDVATEDGLSTVTVTGAWTGTADSPVTGAPAAVTAASSVVNFTSTQAKSITITGERGTVRGRPGIIVDGVTTGFGEGSAMVPYIKFPGQTSYSAGTARPTTDALGDFTWQRRTGKKIYVYFTNEDGDVRSTRIIIQAN